jgi:hypothetical protein
MKTKEAIGILFILAKRIYNGKSQKVYSDIVCKSVVLKGLLKIGVKRF